MDRILSDRAVKILVVVIAVIVAADIVNVFALGGPSLFSLIFKQGSAETTGNLSGVSSAAGILVTNVTHPQTSGTSTNSISAIYVPTTATPIPTVKYVMAVTPIQTQDAGISLAYVMPTAQTTADQTDYAVIYSNNLNFTSVDSPVALAFPVTNPPLIINYTVDPLYITDVNWVYNHTATHAGAYEYQNVTRPSENSWFTITVYDKDSGKQLDQTGYGGQYSGDTQDTYTFRQSGNLLIQFDGENANVQVDMYLDREGNNIS